MNDDVIKQDAINGLVQKLETFGCKPLPESISGQNISFSSPDDDKRLDVILCLLNLDKDRSISINKRDYNYETRGNLYVLLVLYMHNMPALSYLIPSTVFDTPGTIFLNHEQPAALRQFSTWEIKVFTKAIPELSRYALEAVQSLKP